MVCMFYEGARALSPRSRGQGSVVHSRGVQGLEAVVDVAGLLVREQRLQRGQEERRRGSGVLLDERERVGARVALKTGLVAQA